MPKRKCVIGDTSIRNGYEYIKTERGWRLRTVYEYEKAFSIKPKKGQYVLFRDGNKSNFDPANMALTSTDGKEPSPYGQGKPKAPLGHEVVDFYGYTLVKVSSNPSVYLPKQRVVWEQHYGPVPECSRIRFKDGDIKNFAIENLYLENRLAKVDGREFYDKAARGIYVWNASKKAVSKHRYIYEQHFGPVPEDRVVTFADGNRDNYTPSNLILRTLADLIKENQGRHYPEELRIAIKHLNQFKKKLKEEKKCQKKTKSR